MRQHLNAAAPHPRPRRRARPHRSALRAKRWADAVRHYEAALSLNPLNPEAWFDVGYAHLKLDQPLQALKVGGRP